jgi:single-stranded DNA-binding protein
LRVEEWTDRDGKPRHTLEVHATEMQFIGGAKGEGAAAATTTKADLTPEQPADLTDDDIPF